MKFFTVPASMQENIASGKQTCLIAAGRKSLRAGDAAVITSDGKELAQCKIVSVDPVRAGEAKKIIRKNPLDFGFLKESDSDRWIALNARGRQDWVFLISWELTEEEFNKKANK